MKTVKTWIALPFFALTLLGLSACGSEQAADVPSAVAAEAEGEASPPPPKDRELETSVEEEPPADASAGAVEETGTPDEAAPPIVDNRG